MLIRILRQYLQPYRNALLLVVLLQLIQSVAGLYLPSLNADIIDKGVSVGNTGYVLSTGGVMLLVTLAQVACSIGAVFFGARTAMAFGRDLRAGIFHQVGTYSAREVNSFGAPSLITRNTNDVQQVQMLVLMTCTLLVAAPIMCVGGVIMAIRQNAKLSLLLAVAMPVLIAGHRAHHQPDDRRIPGHAEADRPGEPGAARADHRHPGGPGLRPRALRDQAIRRGERCPDPAPRCGSAGCSR